jgi:alcohol dehydrogenase class IV
MSTRVILGEDACDQIPLQAAALKAARALIVTDKGLVKAGILEKVLKHVPAALNAGVFDDVEPDPSVQVVDRGAAMTREKNADLLIAIGGGSPIDAAKGISVVAANGGSATAYEGMDRYAKPPLPVIAIPTTIGTGSEVTFGAVLTNTDTNYKFILYGRDLAPKVAILDPLLVRGIPRSVAIPTGMDALTHGIESYLSRNATPQSRPLALEAIRIICANIEKAVANPNDVHVIGAMLYAANIAGIAFACTRLGIVHAMALPLGAFFHVPHGIANTILLPHGLEFNLGFADAQCRDIAVAMGLDVAKLTDRAAAEQVAAAIRGLIRRLEVPSRLSDVHVTRDKIPAMAADTMKSSHISANPRPIAQSDAAAVYEKAM